MLGHFAGDLRRSRPRLRSGPPPTFFTTIDRMTGAVDQHHRPSRSATPPTAAELQARGRGAPRRARARRRGAGRRADRDRGARPCCGSSSTSPAGSTSSCARASRTICATCCATTRVEVSSPGPERPLTKPDHYRRYLGPAGARPHPRGDRGAQGLQGRADRRRRPRRRARRRLGHGHDPARADPALEPGSRTGATSHARGGQS